MGTGSQSSRNRLLISDNEGFAISESSVYRVLKRHGLVREVRLEGFPASQKYRIKTTRVNEQWQSDASYFFVVGWGWYCLISVLDDYSRMILAWQLKTDMTSASISEVVERALEFTGMKNVLVEDRTRLVSDNGSSYLSHAFEDYLGCSRSAAFAARRITRRRMGRSSGSTKL